jgi:hypothetical protein
MNGLRQPRHLPRSIPPSEPRMRRSLPVFSAADIVDLRANVDGPERPSLCASSGSGKGDVKGASTALNGAR